MIAKFSRVKKIVKLMFISLGSYPCKKPADPKELALWQENLLKLSRQAKGNIYAWITQGDLTSLDFEKFNVSNVLNRSTACKQMLQDLKLPNDTPTEELQFFNAGGQFFDPNCHLEFSRPSSNPGSTCYQPW